jgi:CheY-like chemotaxis protein
MSRLPSILLVEDDETDVLLLRRAFKEAELQHPLHVANDGQEAMEFLTRKQSEADDHLPALIILDLKMPRRTGMDVLMWMRERPILRVLPVIVFSSSANRDDIERSYTLGANAFIVKPPSLGERLELAKFIKQWLRFNQPPLAASEGFSSAQAMHAHRNFAGLPTSPPPR